MPKALLTKDQFIQQFGYDPDQGSAAAAAPATPAAAPTGRKAVLSRDQFIQQFGYDPEETATGDSGAMGEPKTGGLEAGLRSFKQHATFGFGDEITGALEHAFGSKTYEQARDEARAADALAAKEHPWITGGVGLATDIGMSFIPGLGFAKGAKALDVARKAALLGGVTGLGESESSSVGGMAWDALRSAAISGGTAGLLTGALNNAPKRFVQRKIGDITDGATATQRDRLVGAAGAKIDDVMRAISEHKGISAAGGDAEKLVPAVEEAIGTVGQKLDSVYSQAAKAGEGVKVPDVIGRMEKIASDLAKDPGKRDLARAVQGKIADVTEAWGERTHVSPQEVRVFANDIADAAFRGSPSIAPKQGQVIGRQVWGEMKDLITENVQGGLGKEAAKDLASLNKQMSTLLNIKAAAVYKATRGATTSTRLVDRISGGIDTGLALTDPTLWVAKKTYDFVGKPALRAGDDALARLISAARSGSTSAQIAEQAVKMGLAPTVAGALDSWWMDKVMGAARPMDDSQDRTQTAE